MTGGVEVVRSVFLGTSTVYVTDGSCGILIDGFLTRPSLLRVALGHIAPNPERITSGLSRGGIEQLDALFVAHSHHDHVMDSPEIVKRLGGTLYGSGSTVNVGRGANLAEESMVVIADGDEITVGTFTVRVFEGLHSPGDHFPGTIDAPLVPPTRASNYRTDACYSFLITHSTGSMLIHPSANFVPHTFDGLKVDFLYLGVGLLGAQQRQFQDDYWQHVVQATGPARIVPVHWDNFGRSLARKLRPMPFFMDKFGRTRKLLNQKSAESRIPYRFQEPFEYIRPFVQEGSR
jgi:L-ascorbate metabolism protein UlaG (beta-lactamase superfamily)